MEMVTHGKVMALLFVLGILLRGCESDVKCRNDEGETVDWYILYKLPKANNEGLSYLYMDASTHRWKLSKKKINSKSGTLANTLKPLHDFYDRKTEGFGYLLYNDQPPNSKAVSSYGHSKGVVMLDRETGVWLSHSTPKFPAYRSRSFWPNSGNINAQMFICVTFPYGEFQNIGLQLKYIHGYSFDHDLPQTFPDELKCVGQRGCYPKTAPWSSVKNLTSLQGQQFTSFAKYTRFKDDIYSGLIAETMKQNLYVKSWGKMRQPLPSDCSTPFHVFNVKTVRLPNMETFPDTVDHSKWCVTPDDWSCVADMNREINQMNRGGGAICLRDNEVARVFISMIYEYEVCDQDTVSNVTTREANNKLQKEQVLHPEL